MQRRLEQAQILEAIERYVAGVSLRELSKDYNVHHGTVLEHLKRHDIERRSNRRKLTDTQVELAAQRYRAGATLDDIAQDLRVSSETVRVELRRAGIVRRPAGRSRRR